MIEVYRVQDLTTGRGPFRPGSHANGATTGFARPPTYMQEFGEDALDERLSPRPHLSRCSNQGPCC
jgi:hypothetical protein